MNRASEHTSYSTDRSSARLVIGMAAVVVLSMACSAAYALTSDSDQPISVRARSVEANEKTGISIYRGNVVMSQGTLRLEADRVEVTLRDGITELVRAWGRPARIQSRSDKGEELRARALRVVYYGTETRRVDLYGEVEIKRDADVFTASVVHYALDDQTFSAEGDSDGQVSAILQPAKPEPTR
jgi:lipopolysaccharide export system protein LptA